MRYLARLGVVGWMVWDRHLRKPAKKNGRQLVSLEQTEAEILNTEMNGLPDVLPADRIEASARELALRIRAESDLTMPWPRGFDVTVVAGEDGRWHAKCYSPDPVRDAKLVISIRRIAANLHKQFGLKTH
jgi:hypothetical protein